MPVKVLASSNGRGSFDGIFEGVLWAAGDYAPEYGIHVNENPARVINMSLGGFRIECPSAIEDLFSSLANDGIYTVVAAMNNGQRADNAFPANCQSVITVGATGPTGKRAYYSNYSPFVDVMAPGGDATFQDPTNYFSYAGVLSTISYDGEAGYGLMQGTSMATPHVAGVISLMLARDPHLTFSEVRERLHNASAPLSFDECDAPDADAYGLNLCGAGLLDAEAALLGTTLTTPTAYAYDLPYADGVAPTVTYENVADLALLAQYKVETTPLVGGDFSYTIAGMEPGTYEIVGLELRDAARGVSAIDRLGIVEAVEVAAGVGSNPLYS